MNYWQKNGRGSLQKAQSASIETHFAKSCKRTEYCDAFSTQTWNCIMVDLRQLRASKMTMNATIALSATRMFEVISMIRSAV
jgi:hypothetical protein